jgi:flagellar basal body-associated protein FliL
LISEAQCNIPARLQSPHFSNATAESRLLFPSRVPETQKLGMQDAEPKSLEEAGEGGASGMRRWRWLALLVPAAILVVVGTWLVVSRVSEPAAQANSADRIKSTLHLETFVLNLADTEQRSYLRVGIDLGLNQEAKRGEEAAPVAEVRDTILGVLADSKADDLLTAAGKSKLKEKLLHALQQRLPQLGVEEVFFTEFLIQR